VLSVDAYRSSGGVDAGMEAVRSHLAHCPACAAEAAAWEHIASPDRKNALVEPPRYPVFDLSFLPQSQVVITWTQVRAQVRRLAYEIPAALALAGQTLISPPPGLAVSYATVQAPRRAANRAKENLVSLAVDDQQHDVRISLNVTEAEKAIWLAVAMRLLSSGQVLTGARIALCNEQGQAQEIKTVRPGETEARFPDLTPGHYLVRIERSGKTWELPLSL
jgi:anti-sigma factor RsiW